MVRARDAVEDPPPPEPATTELAAGQDERVGKEAGARAGADGAGGTGIVEAPLTPLPSVPEAEAELEVDEDESSSDDQTLPPSEQEVLAAIAHRHHGTPIGREHS